MFTDAHTHLNDDSFFGERQTHIDRFASDGWGILVNIGIDTLRNKRAVEIAEKNINKDCDAYATIWVHPCVVWRWTYTHHDCDTIIDELSLLYTKHTDAVVAIGEIWIDVHFDQWAALDHQIRIFDAQCTLAESLDLPIVIHSRDDFQTTINVLRNHTKLSVYLHSWTYPAEHLTELFELFPDAYVWINGIVTYKNAHDVHDSLSHIPLDRLLIETDAPYLSPVPYRWKPNHPSYISYIYEHIARAKDISITDLQQSQQKNITQFYRLSS